MEKIKVVVVQAGSGGKIKIQEMENSLEASQKFVGGWVEAIRVTDSITLWMDEEGKLKSKEVNFALLGSDLTPYDLVVGDVFFTGTDAEGENTSLTPVEVADIYGRFINEKGFILF